MVSEATRVSSAETPPSAAEATPPPGGGGSHCCQCPGLCRKLKKLFCQQESYDVSVSYIEKTPIIEHSAAEYGLKYEHQLEQPLTAGSLVLVVATPSEDIPRFAINVGTGDSWTDRCDIAFHFNPRMPQRYVVRNTRKHTSWGSEETTSFRAFPFKPGREFTLELLVAESEWLVAVDGEHYCSFSHRLPAGGAAWVQVTDIAQPSVQVRRTDQYPLALVTPPPEAPHRLAADAAPNPAEPHWRPNTCALLPRGVRQGEQVVICGRVRALPHSFHVELAEEWREWPHPAVHLHVNPRLCAAPTRSHQLVVLNSWLDGCWGQERRQATARLIGGAEVRVRLVRDASEWQIWADDVLLGEFTFRADPERVRVLRLRGDLYPRHIYTAPAH